MAGATVTETAILLNISRSTYSKVISAYFPEGNTYSAEINSGRKRKLNERNGSALNRIVTRNHKSTASKVIAEVITHCISQIVFTRTERRELQNLEI
ncbi:hypothetical protein C0J52_26460 [Blattella germanica]|nr:hypothetical protein C0J52_26460 [Blattella germanica]